METIDIDAEVRHMKVTSAISMVNNESVQVPLTCLHRLAADL